MERLYTRQKDRRFTMVAVSLDSNPAPVAPYLKQSGLTFPVALDPRMDLAHSYGVRALPASFIVDPRARGRHGPGAAGLGRAGRAGPGGRRGTLTVGESVGIAVALSAGLFSFLSPCVLPLFPSYLSFITGHVGLGPDRGPRPRAPAAASS